MAVDSSSRAIDGVAEHARSAWWLVLVAPVAVALISLASNITSTAQLSGQADTFLAVRFTVSKLVNAGVVWAALAVSAGWLVKRPWQAAAAGVLSLVMALLVHYGVGHVFGQFDSSVWSDNRYWFAAAVVIGAPLGVVGATARRGDLLGLLAKLVVPVGAVLEPIARKSLTPMAFLPWPDRVSSSISGCVLLAAGVAGSTVVLGRYIRRRAVERHAR